MVKATHRIVWTKRSQLNMKDAFDFISEDSPKNALKVIEGIIEAVDKTTTNPEAYPADKYKLKNDGSFRALEKYSYRIAYRVAGDTIRVLSVRHTSREPQLY